MSRRGPAMLLALLLSVLLGGPVAAVPVAASPDAKAQPSSKPVGTVRIAERVADDDPSGPSFSSPDFDGAAPFEPSKPSTRPASSGVGPETAARASRPLLPFHARAPPVA